MSRGEGAVDGASANVATRFRRGKDGHGDLPTDSRGRGSSGRTGGVAGEYGDEALMNDTITATQAPTLEPPETAPRIRITAGLGSATQKTWNLRRPVTLIGSHRPAHIVLHDRDISHAHCVIVNTGKEVLLKDLHTSSGTLCDGTRIDLTLLQDGNVITVGKMRIQVAIKASEQSCDDSRCGMVFDDPTLFPTPVTVGLLHTDQEWKLHEAVVLVGRHEAAPIWLDHKDIASRHAVFFRFNDQPAVFDLNGQGSVLVNGRPGTVAALSDGDRVSVGPFGLRIGFPCASGTDPLVSSSPVHPDGANGGVDETVNAAAVPSSAGAAGDIDALHARLDALRENIDDSWERLNACQVVYEGGSDAAAEGVADTESEEHGVEAHDAAIRGRLHDVARCQEQLAERELEIERQFSKLQAEAEILTSRRDAIDKRDAELNRRADEVKRREHAVAQRWTRLFAAKCPQCGEQVGPTESGAANS